MILLIYLLAALELPLQAEAIDFERRPGITCGVRGHAANLVWNYDDTVFELRWYYGTEATGIQVGTYVPSSSSFTAFGSYAGEISFTSPVYTAGFNGAKLTFNLLKASDAGNYTTVFQASPDAFDTAVLEVAEPDGLGTSEICVDGTCTAISDPWTLSASADVKVKFTKGGGLTCDMVINVTLSVGVSFVLAVPEGTGATAEHTLADPATLATLLAAEFLSIDLAFGKNGEVFYNHIIPNVSVVSVTPPPTTVPPSTIVTSSDPSQLINETTTSSTVTTDATGASGVSHPGCHLGYWLYSLPLLLATLASQILE